MALSRESKGFLVVLAVFAVLLSGGLYWMLGSPSSPRADQGERVTVVISKGAGLSDIAHMLEREGVVRSALAFQIVARLDGRGYRIQAGTYALERGVGMDTVLGQLAAGPPGPPTFTVTIPEGLTVEQTFQRITTARGSPFTVAELRVAVPDVTLPAWAPVASLPEGAEPLEGLLFPNTYEFRVDASAQDVVARLVHETDRMITSIATPSSGLSPYQILTLASLVEREARLAEERPRISSVIHNRLRERKRLQVDATVLYALGEQKDRVLDADLLVDSPWNTYRHDGLPPTPISGVGEASIRAAVQPTSEDFLYYVVEDPKTGRHRFSRTFAEHQRARAEIRRAGG
ncbi:MAG: endolytic transglycosylase MltG [Egibacteraceae bacterium]